MNDKISCHTSLYNSYYNADIEVRKEEVTPITGVSATAFIKVKDEIIKSNTTISADNTMDFNFTIPYIFLSISIPPLYINTKNTSDYNI